MQEAIQKRAMGEGSYMIPSFDYSAYSSIEIKKLGKPKFRRIREPYKLLPDSFLLPKNGPYTPTFDKFIMRAFDHGLFKKISYKYQFREGLFTVFANDSKCRNFNLFRGTCILCHQKVRRYQGSSAANNETILCHFHSVWNLLPIVYNLLSL